jgi:serine/threonine-protein kinase
MAATDGPADPLALIGQDLLDRYRVTERIAQGGMAVIYRADDERLHRSVCVKVFNGLDRKIAVYQTAYEHFVQEAFTLSQLQHPNILRIYDFGYLDDAHGGAPFHVSELMTEGTLFQHLQKRGPLNVTATREILDALAGALSEAHGRGIVHRDIKPSNILFGSAGARRIVKLADFGIAKVHMDELRNRAGDTRQTVGARVSLFSPGWAAPEQLRGDAVGPAADVFALGLLVAFMLTGRKVFPDDNVLATIAERAQGDAYIQAMLETMKLPDGTGEVIRRACRVDAAERFQTVDELQRVFARVPDPPSPSNIETEPFARVEPRSRLVLERLIEGQVVAAGRRVRLVGVFGATQQIDLESRPLRFRITLLPSAGSAGGLRLHLKGLNCFLARQGARPSGAVDADRDGVIDLKSNDRKRAGTLRLDFGEAEPGTSARLFSVGDSLMEVPLEESQAAVLLDFGAARDLVLLFRGAKKSVR